MQNFEAEPGKIKEVITYLLENPGIRIDTPCPPYLDPHIWRVKEYPGRDEIHPFKFETESDWKTLRLEQLFQIFGKQVYYTGRWSARKGILTHVET